MQTFAVAVATVAIVLGVVECFGPHKDMWTEPFKKCAGDKLDKVGDASKPCDYGKDDQELQCILQCTASEVGMLKDGKIDVEQIKSLAEANCAEPAENPEHEAKKKEMCSKVIPALDLCAQEANAVGDEPESCPGGLKTWTFGSCMCTKVRPPAQE